MKSIEEKRRCLPLKYPEGEDFQVMVSCCSSQRIFCRESGARTMYWHRASRESWSQMRVPLSIVTRTDWQKR